MKIGIVTTWFERGASYVSRAYRDVLLAAGHTVYIYARGALSAEGNPKWDNEYVTWGINVRIPEWHFFHWIEKNQLDVIFYNEERDYRLLAKVRRAYPHIRLGTYVDYYTEDTIPLFGIYDFIICNTKRHMEAMENHSQKYYVRWGTDTTLFKPNTNAPKDSVVFFHSAGYADRKGTDILIEAFIKGELYKRAKLVIHTQCAITELTERTKEEFERYNIEVIEKTVTAPGLYHLGNVYVYPARLDGLGLTMYESLAMGMPVITTDYPPMNEIINDDIGRLVKVKRNYCRQDGYYWPMSLCDINDLIQKMKWYIDNPEMIHSQGNKARERALQKYTFADRTDEINKIFESAEKQQDVEKLLTYIEKKYADKRKVREWILDKRLFYSLYVFLYAERK